MQKILPSFLPLLCLFGLSACVNLKPVPSVTESFILGPVDMVGRSNTLMEGKPVFIARPQLPTYLEDSRLSYRSANGEVRNIAAARWAEPLAEGIARAMSLYLGASEQIAVKGYYPWPNTATDAARLSLNFQRFGATDSGEVQVVTRWTLKQAGGVSKNAQFVSEALVWQTGEPESLIAAYNKALKALALEIEKSLK